MSRFLIEYVFVSVKTDKIFILFCAKLTILDVYAAKCSKKKQLILNSQKDSSPSHCLGWNEAIVSTILVHTLGLS